MPTSSGRSAGGMIAAISEGSVKVSGDDAVNSGSDTTPKPAMKALTIAFLPMWVASAASDVNRSLSTDSGLVESAGAGAIASRKESSSMLAESALPAESSTAGMRTSPRGAIIGLATTTPAVARATPVVTRGPYARRTVVTRLS